MIKYTKGDVTKEKTGLIIHGTNCQGVMGSGVAKAIKERFPKVFTAFQKAGKGKKLLGGTSFISINDNLYVANCYTQEFYGNDGKKYADLNAVASALERVFVFAATFKLTIKSPRIASGLGGLDWETEVKPIFERYSALVPQVEVEIFELDEKKDSKEQK
jgi:O-acetyl-ADP-ribose deacetylase (regulator of RNase III)